MKDATTKCGRMCSINVVGSYNNITHVHRLHLPALGHVDGDWVDCDTLIVNIDTVNDKNRLMPVSAMACWVAIVATFVV